MRKRREASSAEWLRATLTPGGGGRESVSAFHEGLESCAACGRTILPGERVLRLRLDGRPTVLCSMCEATLRARCVGRAA